MTAAVTRPWHRIPRVPRTVVNEMGQLFRRVNHSRNTLWAVTRVEFHKKYAGSVLGVLWHPLYAAMLLGMYCFVFMVVFPVRFKEADLGTYDRVLVIFAGLIPYLGFSDALASTVGCIKSNMALIKNAIFPAELIPVKHLLVSMAGLCISLGILLALLLPTDFFGWHLLYLPVPMALLFVFSLAVIWVVSALAVLLPDLTYIVNLMLLFMIFVSPIAILLEDVPTRALPLMYANPLTHLIESFRFALVGLRTTPLWFDAIFGFASLGLLTLSGTFFRRLMPIFADHE